MRISWFSRNYLAKIKCDSREMGRNLGPDIASFLILYILVKKYRDNHCITIVWVPNIPSIHTVLQTCGIRHCQSHMQSVQYTSFFYLAIENSVGKYQLLLSDNYFLSLKTCYFLFILASKLWFHVVSLWSLPLAIALSGPPCFFDDYRKNVTMINNL